VDSLQKLICRTTDQAQYAKVKVKSLYDDAKKCLLAEITLDFV
jgi:hypothetical protein